MGEGPLLAEPVASSYRVVFLRAGHYDVVRIETDSGRYAGKEIAAEFALNWNQAVIANTVISRQFPVSAADWSRVSDCAASALWNEHNNCWYTNMLEMSADFQMFSYGDWVLFEGHAGDSYHAVESVFPYEGIPHDSGHHRAFDQCLKVVLGIAGVSPPGWD